MDILSFILGICAVLVLAFAIGGVVALVKIIKIEKKFNNVTLGFQQQIDTMKLEVTNNLGQVYQDMDSRLDKQYNKIMKETNPDRILNMIKSKKTSSSQILTDDENKE